MAIMRLLDQGVLGPVRDARLAYANYLGQVGIMRSMGAKKKEAQFGTMFDYIPTIRPLTPREKLRTRGGSD